MKKLVKFSLILIAILSFAFESKAAGISAAITSYLLGPDRVRALFNELKSISQVSCQESYLRQEVSLINQTGLYTFDFRKQTNSTAQTIEPQMQLLGQNDVFVCTYIGMYLYEAISTSVGYVRGGLQTYVNPLYFTTTAGFTKDDLQQVYNGRLQFKVANTVAIEAIDMGMFEAQAITQAFEVAGALDADKTGSKKPEDGLKDLSTFAVMDGSQDNTWIADLPTFNGILWQNTGASLSNRLVLKCHGILVKGGSRYFDAIKDKVSLIAG
jgi:hypothetical protein